MGINQFKQMVFLLEKDVEELKECSLTKDAYNPLFHVAKVRAPRACGVGVASSPRCPRGTERARESNPPEP